VSTNTRDLALTFAGGGNRAFYQLGLLNRWHDRLLPRTAAIAACSAGACVITTFLSGRRAEARDYWMSRTRGIARNFDWGKLLRGERPAPQGAIYHDTLLVTFAGDAMQRIREQPFPIYILAATFPAFLPRGMSVALGIGLYSIERSLRRGPHPVATRYLGFRPFAVDARSCETAEELTNLVLASSSTPPFTPVGSFREQSLLDGGMVDNAPAFVVEERHPELRRSIVLMTRPYHPSVMGVQGHRLYIAPTVPTPIGRWDYTRPHLLDDTVALGEREADVHAPLLERYLGG
jgi:predicted acylesterase/phospholipase RssA